MYDDLFGEDAITELFKNWHKIKQKANKYDWIMGYLDKIEREVEEDKVFEVVLTWKKGSGLYFGHDSVIKEMKIKDIKTLLDD